ncbi:MAG: class I SAM-dependent methyltransferase [Acidobacteria bacterium]|jgi:SAM-dependent methyltransferase|nr:class I SAM-dependent methyltransferase [Acidobacteriota bacterium]
MINARESFGDIDIYLFDQILKSRFSVESEILDAGCGGGRNIVYFLRSGCPVFAVDENPEAIAYIRNLARSLAPKLPSENFQIAKVEAMPFADGQFDAVISNAVLHFAESREHFNRMLQEMWRVLKKDGLLFVRLASSIGIEDKIELINGRRFQLPDGSERFLVDEELLIETTNQLGGIFIEPIKTTNVQNLRCMTTWIIHK